MLASLALRSTFVLVHLVLVLLATRASGYPMGDVSFVYKFWVELGITSDYWLGLDTTWVYPIVAIIPMLAANALGPDAYESMWLVIVVVLNAAAFAGLTGWQARCRNVGIGWWWLGFLALLGPIAVARIDSVTVPLAIIGVLLLSRHPHAAGIVLATATWMKVWPAAIIGALVIASRDRWRLAAGALGLSVLVLLVALTLGGGVNVLSFIWQQSGRGLQIEAPVSLLWLWQAAAGVPGAGVFYDPDILTFQVNGTGVDIMAAMMTPLLALVVSAIVALAIVAIRRGAGEAEVLPPLALALVTALIAFNKVGSPQFISWLAVPIILGLLSRSADRGPSFVTPSVIVFVLAAATQVIYPYLYGYLVALNPLMLALLTARNALLFVLLGWAVVALVKTFRAPLERRSDLEVVVGSVAA